MCTYICVDLCSNENKQYPGKLLRCYTQNIDGLELIASLPSDKLVQAHGGFQAAHCIDCSVEYPAEFVKTTIFSGEIPRCSECQGLVKPDIVFFGEDLPERFHRVSYIYIYILTDLVMVLFISFVFISSRDIHSYDNPSAPSETSSRLTFSSSWARPWLCSRSRA